MKIPNKRELQQITFNHLVVIDFEDFMKKCTAKPHFLVIDATLASDKLIMTIDDTIKERYNKIIIEKQQKCQHYHQVKLINMNILQVKKYYT